MWGITHIMLWVFVLWFAVLVIKCINFWINVNSFHLTHFASCQSSIAHPY